MTTKSEERELFNAVDRTIVALERYCWELPYLVNCKLDRQFYYHGEDLKTAEPEMFISLKVPPRFELRFAIRRNKRKIGSRYTVFGTVFIQGKSIDFPMADKADVYDAGDVIFYVRNILNHFEYSFAKA